MDEVKLLRFLGQAFRNIELPPMSAADLKDIGEALDDLTRPNSNTVEVLREAIINTPETADFMAGVPLEAAHQRDRWGSEHDAGKSPFDWFWLVGYLAQKAAASAVAGDADKAMHHTISTAGALANWHAQLSGKTNVMRPGIGPGNGGEKPGSAFDLASRATLNTLTQGEGQ
jgi:hypothetical protein